MLRDEAAANAVIDRLERVKYEVSDHRLTSSVLLVKEYLRRSALWALAMDCAEGGQVFDIAQLLALGNGDERPLPGYTLLDPEPHSLRADPLEQRILALRQHLRGSEYAVSWQMERCLLWHLRWVTLAADPAVTGFDLPVPYEPLVVLYERGGWFQMRHGEFDFYPLGGFRPGTTARYADQEPVVSLDPIDLDRIDAEPYP